MFDALDVAGTQVEEVIAHLDPAVLDGEDAVALLERCDRLERLAAVGKALAAQRVEESGCWRRRGQRDAVGFVAAHTNTSRRWVRDAMAVAERLGDLAVLDQAVRAGRLTIDQAADIAAATVDHPHLEAELVDYATASTPRQLKDRCIQVMAQGHGAEHQHQRAKAERTASSHTGRDAIWRLHASLPIADGAIVDKALDYFQTQIFDAARAAGTHEPFAAYRADALVAMAHAALGNGASPCEPDANRRRRRGVPKHRSSALRHTIVVTVPHTAFHPPGTPTDPGQPTSHIPGVGPVPTSVVHQLLDQDPVIRAVVTRGRDITAVATLTRTIKDDLRLAVLAGHDHTCAVPTCDNDRYLELDHQIDYANGGPTSADNLRPLCGHHHDQKTNHGYDLRGRPGTYQWIAPDGTILAAERSATPV